MGELSKGRFRWLIDAMCRRARIDVQEVDHSLTYWEAKNLIEKRFPVKLRLKEAVRE